MGEVNAFDARQSDVIQYGDKTGPLDTCGHTMAVAINLRGREGGAMPETSDVASLRAASGGASRSFVAFAQNQRDEVRELNVAGAIGSIRRGDAKNETLLAATAVRRLTPRECERLQGFPDDYTAIPYKGKPAVDGPRYKALGNSMAVPVMRWIGRRIDLVRAAGSDTAALSEGK